MTIEVTEDDIARGGCASDDCPIALAIKRVIGDAKMCVEVSGSKCFIGPVLYALPKVAHKFVKDYDNRKDVKPFEFDLGAKTWVQRV